MNHPTETGSGGAEKELLEIHDRLRDLLGKHGDELPPFALHNARKALACLWQVANGLDADPGHPYELGI